MNLNFPCNHGLHATRGGTQISITMDVSTHVVQDTQREAMSHIDRLLRKRPGRQ
jgi:hypothetical protein